LGDFVGFFRGELLAMARAVFLWGNGEMRRVRALSTPALVAMRWQGVIFQHIGRRGPI
jgi:hypothetical protein